MFAGSVGNGTGPDPSQTQTAAGPGFTALRLVLASQQQVGGSDLVVLLTGQRVSDLVSGETHPDHHIDATGVVVVLHRLRVRLQLLSIVANVYPLIFHYLLQ